MKEDDVAQGLWSVPSNWSWVPIREVAEVIGGGTPRTGVREYWDQGKIPWITPADLSGYRHKLISHGARNITDQGLRNSGARLAPAGTVLFTSRAPIGYVAIAAQQVCTNQGFKSFSLQPGIEPGFLYFYLQRSLDLIRSLASGTTFLEISGKKAAEIPFPVSPHSEQLQIVEVLDSYFTRLDAAEQALLRAQANLKRYRASVLKAAVEGRLVPTEAELARQEGREYEPASVLLARILAERKLRWEKAERAKMKAKGIVPKDDRWKAKYEEPVGPSLSGLPELPEGWCWVRAEQISEFITKGTTPAPDLMSERQGEIPYVKVYNLTFDGALDFTGNRPTFISNSTHRELLARSICLPGDVLMNIVGPPLGKVSILPEAFAEWNINQAIARYRPLPGLSTSYLALAARGFSAVSHRF